MVRRKIGVVIILVRVIVWIWIVVLVRGIVAIWIVEISGIRVIEARIGIIKAGVGHVEARIVEGWRRRWRSLIVAEKWLVS